MRVELGNPNPKHARGPAVTSIWIPDESYGVGEGSVSEHLAEVVADPSNQANVTHLPGQEALISIVHPTDGMWVNEANAPPTWVSLDNPELERQLAEHYGCPAGSPDDLEDTHHTNAGPPGVHPGETT